MANRQPKLLDLVAVTNCPPGEPLEVGDVGDGRRGVALAIRNRIEITSRKPLDTNPKRQRGDSFPIADTPRSCFGLVWSLEPGSSCRFEKRPAYRGGGYIAYISRQADQVHRVRA